MMQHMIDLAASLGSTVLRTPLIAASGTVGSVFEWEPAGSPEAYGAAVAKSVSGSPWAGHPGPRMAPAGEGMLNGIGIQNAGIDAWRSDVGPRIAGFGIPVWGSAVGETPDEFARVAKGLEAAGVTAIELNLSCPNVDGIRFALDPDAAWAVTASARSAVSLPIAAKLSPDAPDIVGVASAVAEAGADWVVLTNTIPGAAIDVETGRPALASVTGGLSGPPLRPIALRCVLEVHRALPEIPIVGCGGVSHGDHVAEYLLAGASAVALGTVHFAEPRAGRRILKELVAYCRRAGFSSVADVVGKVEW